MSTIPAWIHAKGVVSERRTNYPEPFAQRVAGRERRRLEATHLCVTAPCAEPEGSGQCICCTSEPYAL